MKKKERALMNALYALCGEKGQGVYSEIDLLKSIPYGVDFREEDLEQNLENLSLDGYLGFEKAMKKGETVYCVTLKERGLGYKRERRTKRGKILFRIGLTIALAVLSYFVKVLVDMIVS